MRSGRVGRAHGERRPILDPPRHALVDVRELSPEPVGVLRAVASVLVDAVGVDEDRVARPVEQQLQ